MKAAHAVKTPLTRSAIWRALRSSLLSAPFLTLLVFIGLSPFILSGLIVFFMRSFLYAPSGAWAISALAISLAASLMGMALLIRESKSVRRDRKQGVVRTPVIWGLTLFFVALKLSIAPGVALAIWSQMQTPDVRIIAGKPHLRSPHEQLVPTLLAVEARGIWTWYPKG